MAETLCLTISFVMHIAGVVEYIYTAKTVGGVAECLFFLIKGLSPVFMTGGGNGLCCLQELLISVYQ